MNDGITNTRVMLTLIRREFLEHRIILIYIPLILTGVAMLFYTAAFVDAAMLEPGQPVRGLATFVYMPDRFRHNMLANMYSFPIRLMMLSFSATMLFYYVNALVAQRRNRSILFWNSLPVSDTQMILSKLLAGLVCCQMLYLLCYLVLALFVVLAALAFGAGIGIDAWTGFISPSYLPSVVGQLVSAAPLEVLWMLPVSAALLLASGWARQSPFIWAVGPVALLIVIELMFFQEKGFEAALPNTLESVVARTVFEHVFPLRMFSTYVTFPLSELALSALLGAILVFAAIRLNRADEN